jgi:hypothetical protein
MEDLQESNPSLSRNCLLHIPILRAPLREREWNLPNPPQSDCGPEETERGKLSRIV